MIMRKTTFVLTCMMLAAGVSATAGVSLMGAQEIESLDLVPAVTGNDALENATGKIPGPPAILPLNQDGDGVGSVITGPNGVLNGVLGRPSGAQ